jgi:hypothetical protein
MLRPLIDEIPAQVTEAQNQYGIGFYVLVQIHRTYDARSGYEEACATACKRRGSRSNRGNRMVLTEEDKSKPGPEHASFGNHRVNTKSPNLFLEMAIQLAAPMRARVIPIDLTDEAI